MVAKRQVGGKSTGKAVVKSAKPKGGNVVALGTVFASSGDEVNGDQVWQFINEKAGGNPNNIKVQPLDNFKVSDPKPTPFGYARPGGTRAQFHDFHGKGVDGDFRLGNMLDKMRGVDGHSKQRMICTVALLNGGYSRSSKTWGIPFIKLVAQAS
tara:strand:- start:227 stop:688 length:462 start_codon:yes stop_codon:yes gene_type:complete